jgi:hypothetical protein
MKGAGRAVMEGAGRGAVELGRAAGCGCGRPVADAGLCPYRDAGCGSGRLRAGLSDGTRPPARRTARRAST